MRKEQEANKDRDKLDMGVIDKFCMSIVLFLLLTTSNNWANGAEPPSKPPLSKEEGDAVIALINLAEVPQKLRNSLTTSQCDQKSIFCKCNTTSCHVTKIDLSNCDLIGTIPREVGNLAHLTDLLLNGNKLHGSIPTSLVNLQSLSHLDVSANSLSGNLPPFQMKSLQYMYLSDNKLDGPVPKSFLNLTSLLELDLSDNSLGGNLPPFQMKSLQYIDLGSNCFRGQIPHEYGALQSVIGLYVDNNLLTGSIPQELGELSNLVTLEVNDNKLSGHISHQLGKLIQLQYLDLRTNYFDGELPLSFMRLTNLTQFLAQGNSLSGKIPKLIANWTELKKLYMLGNNFEGPLPKEISSMERLESLKFCNVVTRGRAYDFPDLSHMTLLRELTLRNCSLRGPIPNYIWELQSLQYLDLSFNELSGEVPKSISTSLTYIFLRVNKLNGSLPGWLMKRKNATSHRYVDVSENFFTNTTSVSNALSNQDVNTFPGCSSNLKIKNQCDSYCHPGKYTQLFINCGGESVTVDHDHYYADLNPNGTSTFFIDERGGWGYSSMGHTTTSDKSMPFIYNKTCNLTMPQAVLFETARVAPVSLKYYGFCFINGTYTVKLHFTEIPSSEEEDSPIRRRRVFDIDIQGKTVQKNYNIEEAQVGVDGDKILRYNVSIESQLVIHLYWSGNGSILYPANYGPLISAISVVPVPKPAKHPQKLSTALKAGIAGSSLGFLALLLLVLWKLGCLGGKRSSKEELKATELFPGGVYTFHQIKAATENFNAVNKLGEGGFGPVYKGLLPDGTTIAVKKLSAKSKQGIHEFVNEIGMISALQHPNLVKLMGCCAEDNELLLIYEYMENNNLDHALFGSEELKSRLNWSTRVKIILGIAKGLTYLHEESKLKIIHRDIKPTNILLDKELNAKIADFGYAKLNEGEHTHVITRIAGTTGYMAPEYAMRGHLTTKADVYSFGVVTLEIVSGRNSASYRPSDQTVYLLDLAYVLHEQGNLMDLVDPKLGTDYSWTEASAILELAMMCTNPSPTLRPTMSEVVNVIEGKTKIKTTSSIVRRSTDEIALTKAMAALSESSQSESYSTPGPSEVTPSCSNSNNNITNET
ncbi:putative LRR receptor-like serine/threonine-protein kinase [Capsicum galapagoense]